MSYSGNSDNSKSSASSGGIGFSGALTLLFIALKLTDVIDWSWWWVLSPIWVSFVAFLVFVAVILLWVWLDRK